MPYTQLKGLLLKKKRAHLSRLKKVRHPASKEGIVYQEPAPQKSHTNQTDADSTPQKPPPDRYPAKRRKVEDSRARKGRRQSTDTPPESGSSSEEESAADAEDKKQPHIGDDSDPFWAKQYFDPLRAPDPANSRIRLSYESITVAPAYSAYSFEELRVKAYKHHNPNSLVRSAPRSFGGATRDRENVSLEEKALQLLAELGYTGISLTNLTKLEPSDDYEKELDTMAEVWAYFDVAFQRVVDGIPQLIDEILVRGVAQGLFVKLFHGLKLGDLDVTERCRAYLDEADMPPDQLNRVSLT